jgi:NAD(P)-dependent dehydrogenase (short-subunit alcohol dehydrogenase family)
MVDEGVKAFGAIHYCVNNAGVTSTPRARSHELPVAAWDRVQGINLRGVWLKQEADLVMKYESFLSAPGGEAVGTGCVD